LTGAAPGGLKVKFKIESADAVLPPGVTVAKAVTHPEDS
jgi:hypothetical protein